MADAVPARPEPAPAARVVCVLGMHRSGTSCLAGTLQEAGVCLGEVNTAATHNAKGNRENRRIWRLHDRILQFSDGSWSRPPSRVGWNDDHRAERDAIIHSYAGIPLWGFKDPRALLALEFWREALPNLTFVGTFRHPIRVAESLRRREGGEFGHWVDVWFRYNERLLALYRSGAFPILRFDLGEAAYRETLTAALHCLGLPVPSRMDFFDADLRHHEADVAGVLPESVSALYHSLCRIALVPEGTRPDAEDAT